MKLGQLLLIFSVSTLSYFTAVSNAEEIDNYKLSVDDKISVSIFNEPELGINNVKISTSGTISMPLIGQISIKDLTVSEVENLLTKKYFLLEFGALVSSIYFLNLIL